MDGCFIAFLVFFVGLIAFFIWIGIEELRQKFGRERSTIRYTAPKTNTYNETQRITATAHSKAQDIRAMALNEAQGIKDNALAEAKIIKARALDGVKEVDKMRAEVEKEAKEFEKTRARTRKEAADLLECARQEYAQTMLSVQNTNRFLNEAIQAKGLEEMKEKQKEIAQIITSIESSADSLDVSSANPSILDTLNDQQREAVTTTEGYVRVIAGAGTGKTRALTHRYAYLVKKLGIAPKNILCVTFTNKAAQEMKKRVGDMTGGRDFGYICTFHKFCVHLLKEDYKILQWPQAFRVIDEADKKTILQDVCFPKLGINSKQITIKEAVEYIATVKATTDYYQYFEVANILKLMKLKDKVKDIREKLFYEYLHEQMKTYAFDFNDLLNVTLYILNKDEEIRSRWQKRLNYIMVDEFQDVDKQQCSLIEILSDYHKNLFIVGDPDQTIYTWRGAHIEFIRDFDKLHSNCKTIIVDKNYRSAEKIINAANSLIDKNQMRIKKNLEAIKQSQGKVVYFHAKSQQDEAEWITNQIKSILQSGIKPSDIMILYRIHSVSRPIEEKLVRAGVPHKIYSGTPFYGREEVKDILGYLHFIAYKDDLSFERIINKPARQIGKKSIAALRSHAEQNNCSMYQALLTLNKKGAQDFIELIEKYSNIFEELRLTDLLANIMQESGYEEMLRSKGDYERLDNLAELKQAIYDYEMTSGEDISLVDYFNEIALYTNADTESAKDAVKLMSVHSVKGLESPIVFVVALNEGIFPSMRVESKEQLEEERRIAYVAFTRARDMLFLSDSEGRSYDGSFRYPSRFIFNAERVNVDYLVELDTDLYYKTKEFIKDQEALWDDHNLCVGDIIVHPDFGRGKIIGLHQYSYEVKFDGLATPRQISYSAEVESLSNTV